MSFLSPPSGFIFVEEAICRASLPIKKENLQFLEHLDLSTIIVLTEEDLGDFIKPFCHEHDITLHILPFFCLDEFNVVAQFNDWAVSVLQLLISLHEDGTTMLLGGSCDPFDAVVIACLRKLQQWGMTSVFEEFRIIARKKMFDLEQYVEFFDISGVKLPFRLPNFLTRSTEELDFASGGEFNEVGLDLLQEDGDEGRRRDAADKQRLMFPSRSEIISSDVKFDKSLSLVTDEIED